MILRQLSPRHGRCWPAKHSKWSLLLGAVCWLGSAAPIASAQDAGSRQSAAAFRHALQAKKPPVAGFYSPSSAEAVSRAIVAQRRALIRELREKKLLQSPSTLGQNPDNGLRRVHNSDGVIVLTNHSRAARKPEPTTAVRLPADEVREHQLNVGRVVEQSSVVAPLQPFDPNDPHTARAAESSDTGLDIALATLVAFGLGLLGFSAWQRSQLP